MPPRRDPLKEAFNAIQALRDEGVSESGIAHLRSIFRKQNGMVIARAAGLAVEWFESSLVEAMVSCYYRLRQRGVELDSQCWGKTALVKALQELAWQDTQLYIDGCRTVQLEPVRGGKEDTAVALRIASLNALMQSVVVDKNILMMLLADLLADESKRVRAEAANLSSYAPPTMAAPLLRLKIHLGDADSRVLGNCFDSLLSLMPNQESIKLIHSYTLNNDALQAEAVAALASSSLSEAVSLVLADYDTFIDLQLKRIVLTSLSLSTTAEALDFLLNKLSDSLSEASIALEALKPKLHDLALKAEVARRLSQRKDELANALN